MSCGWGMEGEEERETSVAHTQRGTTIVTRCVLQTGG